MLAEATITYGFIVDSSILQSIGSKEEKENEWSPFEIIRKFSYGEYLISNSDSCDWKNSDKQKGEYLSFSVPFKWVEARYFGLVSFEETIPQSVKDSFNDLFSKFLSEFKQHYPKEAKILEELSLKPRVIVRLESGR